MKLQYYSEVIKSSYNDINNEPPVIIDDGTASLNHHFILRIIKQFNHKQF